ncbi:MAG: hypothetical protein AN488_20170 [Anabaena sp. WA113]|nr:MAG: hypothetical protein AN488_20170 [Anabaena sp. WA113]
MTSTPLEPNLKDRIFEICENLYKKSEKVSREKVRSVLGGGSFSTIGPMIKEWKEQKKVQLSSEGTYQNQLEDVDQEESNIVLSPDSKIESPTEQLYPTNTQADFIPDDDMSSIVRAGAEKAASLLIAQEAVASHYFQNPNELPEDLKQQLQGMRGNFTQARSQAAMTAFSPQKMINMVMSKVKKPDQEELIG